MNYKEEFSKIIFSAINLKEVSLEEIVSAIKKTPSKDLGDFSFPTFFLSKIYKKPPKDIAKEIIEKIPISNNYSFLEINGYINLKINESFFMKNIIFEVLKKEKDFGKQLIDKKQYVIDSFNANPLKTLHIGHLRNIVTGDFVYRILKFVGSDPKQISYGGDIGTHVARWYWYYLKLPENEKQIPAVNVSKWFGKIYIESGKLLEENKDVYKKEIDLLQLKILQDDVLKKEIKKYALESHKAYMEIAKELDVSIDHSFFESDSENKFLEIKDQLFSNKDLFKEDDGAIVADLKDKELGNFILVKQNGAPLYGAKDIGLVLLKKEKYPSCNDFLYVIASEQDFYLKQLFKLFEFIYPATNHFHISHGLVNTSEGKMKSREGDSYLYEDFRDQLYKKVEEKIIENGLTLDNLVVKQITFGVLKFEMLKTNLNKTIVFDIESCLDFQGDTAPYVLYSGVRAKSILKKANFKKDDDLIVNYSLEKEELLLADKINDFKEVIYNSYSGYKPQVIVNYVLELSRIFNKFYVTCPAINSDDNIKKIRLSLINSFLITLENALDILGITIPEKM
jgi:arginyl-tRNA synthetase